LFKNLYIDTKLLFYYSGQDITKPPPDASGDILYNKETLSAMTKPQLLLLCSRTAGIQGVSSKKKEDIVEKLLTNLPECQQPAKRKYKGGELPALKKALLDKTSKNTPIVDFYNDHYGWLDQVDKDYYKIVNSTYHRTYGKLLGCTILMFFVRNVWALCEERKMAKDSGRGVNKDMNEKKRGKRLVKFVADVCTFIKAL
jgi:hypothetical protein